MTLLTAGCGGLSVATPCQFVTMLVGGCRALSLLAELFCVLGLLVLCVLKVQHFLSFPVSTTVSYQRSRPPSITFCHQLTDQEAVNKLQEESWAGYIWLQTEVRNARYMLLDVKNFVLGYSANYLPQKTDNSPRPDSDALVATLGSTKDSFEKQMRADKELMYSGMNDIMLLFRDVLNNSTVIFGEILGALEPPDLPVLTSLSQNLESLFNVIDDIEARLRGSDEWEDPPPARLLVDGARRVDQFVISCRRGNTSCMPGEGGVWRLRHILETDERCYTLQAPEEDDSDETAELVLELRGNKWKEKVKDETPKSRRPRGERRRRPPLPSDPDPFSEEDETPKRRRPHSETRRHPLFPSDTRPVRPVGSSEYGDDAAATTIETTASVTVPAVKTTTEASTLPEIQPVTEETTALERETNVEETTVQNIETITEVTRVPETDATTDVAMATTTGTTETLPLLILEDEHIEINEVNSSPESTFHQHAEYDDSKPDPPPILKLPLPMYGTVKKRPETKTSRRIAVPPPIQLQFGPC